jgi:hypothetical protein
MVFGRAHSTERKFKLRKFELLARPFFNSAALGNLIRLAAVVLILISSGIIWVYPADLAQAASGKATMCHRTRSSPNVGLPITVLRLDRNCLPSHVLVRRNFRCRDRAVMARASTSPGIENGEVLPSETKALADCSLNRTKTLILESCLGE